MTNPGKEVPESATLRAYVNPRNLLLALSAGVVISMCGFLVDHLVHNAKRLLASDLYTCAIAFLFSYVLLQWEARRRANLARRMEIAAEVNHHIRNALTAVVYTAAVRSDPELQAVLEDATARIEWVLNTVLPDGSKALQWPVQTNAWRPSSWSDQAAKPKAAPVPPSPGSSAPCPVDPSR